MPKLIATQRLVYNGRWIKRGGAFFAKKADAKILKGIGKAKDAPIEPPDLLAAGYGGGYARRDLLAETPAAEGYGRRDMQADPAPAPIAPDDAETVAGVDIVEHNAFAAAQSAERARFGAPVADVHPGAEPLRNLTNAKLREVAAAEGIAVGANDTKAELIAKIEAARERRARRDRLPGDEFADD